MTTKRECTKDEITKLRLDSDLVMALRDRLRQEIAESELAVRECDRYKELDYLMGQTYSLKFCYELIDELEKTK